MVVLRDINHLWNTDINNNTIAAVLDRSEKIGSPWGGIKNYKDLGLNPESKYFNSGLLVIDLVKWRELNVTELVIKAVVDNSKYVTFADQYGLNLVFVDDWFELDKKWNSYAQDANESPYLIHFTGMKPIFKGYDFNEEYKLIFYKYLRLTPWSGFKPKRDYMRFVRKLRNVITKKITQSFFPKPIPSK